MCRVTMKCNFRLLACLVFFTILRLSSAPRREPPSLLLVGDSPLSIRFAPVCLKIHLCEATATSKTSHLRASRSQLGIWLAGDVEVNPGPSRWRYPCGICCGPVKKNQRGDVCLSWHTRCMYRCFQRTVPGTTTIRRSLVLQAVPNPLPCPSMMCLARTRCSTHQLSPSSAPPTNLLTPPPSLICITTSHPKPTPTRIPTLSPTHYTLR